MDINIKNVNTSAEINECLAIRKKVFVEGMNVPEERDVDGLDDISDHFLVKLGTAPVGTVRIRYVDGKAKIGRVAILPDYQSKGYGKVLILHMINFIKHEKKMTKIILAAQMEAINFYTRLGFEAEGEAFEDAGIMHKYMNLTVA